MRAIIVIPARHGSTRFPGKPLSKISGKPMIQWTYEAAARAQGVDQVVVATDDSRILEAVEGFGGRALMTSADLKSGTDRVAEVADQLEAEFYINVQGDEPLMEPEHIEKALGLVRDEDFDLGTLMTPLTSVEELQSPHVVKVLARGNEALTFSRLPIPWGSKKDPLAPFGSQRHLGLYSYSREALFRFRDLPPGNWEQAESLEQLRALEAGMRIGIAEVQDAGMGVDTPEDLKLVEGMLKKREGHHG